MNYVYPRQSATNSTNIQSVQTPQVTYMTSVAKVCLLASMGCVPDFTLQAAFFARTYCPSELSRVVGGSRESSDRSEDYKLWYVNILILLHCFLVIILTVSRFGLIYSLRVLSQFCLAVLFFGVCGLNSDCTLFAPTYLVLFIVVTWQDCDVKLCPETEPGTQVQIWTEDLAKVNQAQKSWTKRIQETPRRLPFMDLSPLLGVHGWVLLSCFNQVFMSFYVHELAWKCDKAVAESLADPAKPALQWLLSSPVHKD
jgi:hypothetical protein